MGLTSAMETNLLKGTGRTLVAIRQTFKTMQRQTVIEDTTTIPGNEVPVNRTENILNMQGTMKDNRPLRPRLADVGKNMQV